MTRADLNGPLLASVSRSFYLTIRALPAPLRAPIGLAYLLARASDTIADSADAPAEIRLRHLAALDGMVARGAADPGALAELERDIQPAAAAERTLIEQLPRCLEWLEAIDENERAEIAAVLREIIRGQSLDVQRFPTPGARPVVALASAAEVEDYTYLVAGCVGEFWTRLCLARLPRFSAEPPEMLASWGVNFGKGLQLVNILRDLPADLREGRCYLPADELAAAGATPAALLSDPQSARPVFARWHARAAECLDDGHRYIAALRPARLRAACFLPWYLGVQTLALLAARPPLETPERVKVPRRTVRFALALAPLVAISNLPLRWAAHHSFGRK